MPRHASRAAVLLSLTGGLSVAALWGWGNDSGVALGWEARVWMGRLMYQERYGLFGRGGAVGFATSQDWLAVSAEVLPLNPGPHTGLFYDRDAAGWPLKWNGSKWGQLGFVYDHVDVPGFSFSRRTAAGPLATGGGVVLRRRRARAGRCGSCGYDLRGTPDRCPECGAVAAGGVAEV